MEMRKHIKSIVYNFDSLYPLLCNKKSIEHIVPRSLFNNSKDSNDLQNLSCESLRSNMKRSNIKFGKFGNDLPNTSKNSIALSVLYMIDKYKLDIDNIFTFKDIFYDWATLNQISMSEYNRQNIIFAYDGTVNQFIYYDVNMITKELDLLLS